MLRKIAALLCGSEQAESTATKSLKAAPEDPLFARDQKSAQELIFQELRRSLDRQYENSQALDRKAAFILTAASVVVGFIGVAEGPAVDPHSVSSVREAFTVGVVSIWMMVFIGIYLLIVRSFYDAYQLREREAGTLGPSGLMKDWERTEKKQHSDMPGRMLRFLARAHDGNTVVVKVKAENIHKCQRLLGLLFGWLAAGLFMKWLYSLFVGLGTYATGNLYWIIIFGWAVLESSMDRFL